MGLLVVAGLLLRLRGFHDPILDHPGWRQGDTAAIARNFATLQFNIFFPQVDYDGPPPNYVELELQIVPFLAACGYKLFGIHEGIGRLISIAFGLGTIVVTGAFARWLFRSALAGLCAAAIFTALPGSIYYARTFMPDTTMVFFFTAAIYACCRYYWDEDERSWRGFPAAALLLALAFLAKPVAVIAIVPIGCAALARYGRRATLVRPQTYALLAVAFVPLAVYGRFEHAHAEWDWASGITEKHVIPSLRGALTSTRGFASKLAGVGVAARLLARTMLGPFGVAFLIAGFALGYRRREAAILYGWLGAALIYVYVVVTVERVDYYMYPFLPLAAIVGGNLVLRVWLATRSSKRWQIAAAAAALVYVAMISIDRRLIAPYYAYSRPNYVAARALDATLAPGSLIVMGHYDPSIMYYINRKGWEEDPYIWTPFDEQSAIRKGARYFISVEHRRLRKNRELYAWLARFPVDERKRWPVYETDPAKILPGAEARWKAFRRAERAGALPPN
jgi:4-amino-4-deoxy-L-arabinose transferase-like glycosyltransferase